MQTIGLLGGMSWESTTHYYQLINTEIKQQLGGLHSAKIILNSVDFAEIAELQKQGDWQRAGELLSEQALKIQLAGADMLLICTNTMHLVYPQIKQRLTIPVLHIAESTGIELKQQQVNKVALLGTAFTMEQTFYRKYLTDNFELEVIVPDEVDRKEIHRIIFDELCLGIINPKSKLIYLQIIEKLRSQGIQGIILGCTEIGLLVQQRDTDIPLFDTTEIHAKHAVKVALS